MTRLAIRAVVWLMAGCGAAAIAGCVAAQPATHPPVTVGAAHIAGRVNPDATFLDVTTSAMVSRSTGPFTMKIIRYPVSTLVLRSVRTGRVMADLLRSLGGIDAVTSRSGSVIAVVSYGCRSQVLRIDPATGRTSLIRVLPWSAGSVAVSPDGHYLAYLTYPTSRQQTCSPDHQPTVPVRATLNPGGPAEFLPNVVAVTDLESGATVRAATSNPGQPPMAPSWSPDGTRVAVTYTAGNSIVLLNAAQPDFAIAPRLRAPRNCGFGAATWTARGIVAVTGCGPQRPGLSPEWLWLLSPAGQRAASWALPACIDGVTPFASPDYQRVLVQADVGYGNGACGKPRPGTNSIRILEAHAASLHKVAVLPSSGGLQLQVTGW